MIRSFLILSCILLFRSAITTDLKGNFAVVNDIHLDKFYQIDSSISNHCHNGTGDAKKYGQLTWNCDCPLDTANEMFNWFGSQIENNNLDLDFVLWLGDNSRHDWDDEKGTAFTRTAQEIYTSVKNVSTLLKTNVVEKKNTIKVVPVIGNNDYYPHNQFPAQGNNTDVINNLLEGFQEFMTQSEIDDFKLGGYYQKTISDSLGILILNTNTLMSSNSLITDDCDVNDSEGDKQFKYFENILQTELAKTTNNKQFIIAGHMPPTSDYFKAKCLNRYQSLTEKYQSLILSHQYAHEHNDEFYFLYKTITEPEKQYDILDCNDAIGVINVLPSISPTFNPGIRVYNYVTTPYQHKIQKYDQYYANNQKIGAGAAFSVSKEYTFPDYFGDEITTVDTAAYCKIYKKRLNDVVGTTANKLVQIEYLSTTKKCFPTLYYDSTSLMCKKCSVTNCFKCDSDSAKCDLCQHLYEWDAISSTCKKIVNFKLKGTFGIVTDIHYQKYYKENADVELHCQDGTGDSLRYGTQGWHCDCPKSTVENMYDWWKNALQKKQHDIDFLLWLGDNARHDWSSHSTKANLRTPEELLEEVTFMTQLTKTSFHDIDSSIQIVPTIGNNDYIPHDQFSPQPYNQMLRELNGQFSQYLNPSEIKTFLQGGYYEKVIADDLSVLVLNTNLIQRSNFWTKDCDNPEGGPNKMLTWIENVLEASFTSVNKKYFIIVGHEPPIYSTFDHKFYFKDACYSRYLKLSEKYSSIIIAHQYGHEHSDRFYLIQKEKNTNLRKDTNLINCDDVTGYVNVLPSISPTFNPATRIVTYNTEAPHNFESYKQYFLDTKIINKKGTIGIEDIKLEYEFPSYFGLDKITAKDYCNLHNSIINKENNLDWKYNKVEYVCSDIKCLAGQFLSTNYECISCTEHCLACTSEDSCTQCETSYTFDTTKKQCVIQNKPKFSFRSTISICSFIIYIVYVLF